NDLRRGLPQMEAAFAALKAAPLAERAQLPAPQIQGTPADEEYHRGALIIWLAHVGRHAEALDLGATMAARGPGTTARGLSGLGIAYAVLGRVAEAQRAQADARAAFQAAGQHHELSQLWKRELDMITLFYEPDRVAERRHQAGEAARVIRL